MDTVTEKRRDYANHIAGKSVPASDGRTFESTNPTTGKVWGRFAESSRADVDSAVRAAAEAFEGPWGKLSPTRRGRLLMAWGDRIADNAETIARLETPQNGKLLNEMRAQAQGRPGLALLLRRPRRQDRGAGDPDRARQCAQLHAARAARRGRRDHAVELADVPHHHERGARACRRQHRRDQAVGGHVGLRLRARAARRGGGHSARRRQRRHRRARGGRGAGRPSSVAKIAFTGGEAGGKAIAARAGARLAGVTLELGGKSANIVFPDADLEQAEAGVLAGIFAAAGQTCVAGSRAFVHESIYDEHARAPGERARAIRLGDPLLAATQMGPGRDRRRSSRRTRAWSSAR